MAKLGAYYGLCPLIESKSLLGVFEDPENGVVIVTLGKNIASRYRLSDQKQISCWKTKEKFSSLVIFHKKISKYIAVFNQSYLKLWDRDDENLDKLKKYKFTKQIYTIFSSKDSTFVVFQNGSICTLENALESRKALNGENVISDSEQIKDILYANLNDEFYIGLIVKSNEDLYLYWTMYNLMNYFGKMKLSRDDYQTDYSLKGYIFHSFENTVHLLTLWSDRRIFSQALEDSEDSLISSDLFGVIESVSAKYAVCMLALDANYIAMFGANCNEEGAVLLIYNTQFKVTQSKQSFKLFTNGARLWCYENNLLLPVGQNLAVVPFYLETEQLAALIGSHKIVNDEVDADIAIVQEFEVGSWDKKMKLRDVSIPGSLKFKIEEAVKKGLPESIITEELLSSIVNDQDLESLMLYLNTFLDIPEKLIAKILKFLINANKKIFPNQSRSMSKLFPSDLQPLSRTELIDKILCKPFSDILLIPHLRSELALADVITLLRYICFLCSEEGHLLPGLNVVKSQAALIEWCLAVVDANYQKLLFSKDDCVTDVVNEIDNMVAEHLVPVEDFKFLLTILNYYKAKRMNSNSVCINNVKYSIEQVCFY